MTGQRLGARFREPRRDQRNKLEQFEKVRTPKYHMDEIRAAKERKDRAKAEVAAADQEIGELFARLIEQDWDLKAAALEIGLSRQMVYKLIEKAEL